MNFLIIPDNKAEKFVYDARWTILAFQINFHHHTYFHDL